MLLLVRFFILAIALAAVAISPLHAAECTIPNAFTAGTPAVAVEVNANFASVASAVDDNDGRIEALVARIVSMRRQITAIQDRHAQLQSENAALLSRLAAVQGNAVLDLDGVLTRESDTLARFFGVNVQIVNGTGVTDGEVNGVGNLIVGYNEKEASEDRTGSHTAVVCIHHPYSSYAGLVVGNQNTVSGIFTTVSGGIRNTASGEYSSVSGGSGNEASGEYSSVTGGSGNNADDPHSSISACENCTTDGEFDFEAQGIP